MNKQEEISIPRKLSILIADDSTIDRRIMKQSLIQLGLRDVTEASDGDAAIKLCKEKEFDLIISDYRMPKISGMELLKAVNEMGNQKEVKFLMITGSCDKEFVMDCLKAGASSFIVKPFSLGTIEEKLSEIF